MSRAVGLCQEAAGKFAMEDAAEQVRAVAPIAFVDASVRAYATVFEGSWTYEPDDAELVRHLGRVVRLAVGRKSWRTLAAILEWAEKCVPYVRIFRRRVDFIHPRNLRRLDDYSRKMLDAVYEKGPHVTPTILDEEGGSLLYLDEVLLPVVDEIVSGTDAAEMEALSRSPSKALRWLFSMPPVAFRREVVQHPWEGLLPWCGGCMRDNRRDLLWYRFGDFTRTSRYLPDAEVAEAALERWAEAFSKSMPHADETYYNFDALDEWAAMVRHVAEERKRPDLAKVLIERCVTHKYIDHWMEHMWHDEALAGVRQLAEECRVVCVPMRLALSGSPEDICRGF